MTARRMVSRSVPLLAVGCGLLALRALTRRIVAPSFRGKTVLITGGARGLGLEMARLWAGEGANLALCSRTAADVKAAAEELGRSGSAVLGQSCDVTDANQVKEFVRAVLDRWGRIDVLVNNAGVIQAAPAACMTVDDYQMAMQTHFFGPLLMIDAVLPSMRRNGEGRIVNIASIGGKVSVPHLLPYNASKFALVGFSEGLRNELAREGITVTTICPGLMRTGSPRNALFKGRHRAEYAWFNISSSLPGVTMSSRRAARKIIEACRHGDAEVILSLPAKVAARVNSLFPEATSQVLSVVNRLLPSPGGIGTQTAKGAESESAWSPSVLTTLSDRAAVRNNEVGQVGAPQ